MISIRGAITVSKNTKIDILESTKLLLLAIISSNKLDNDDIISIYFTATKDITKAYPAVAAREIGLTECSLSCVQEMYVEGSMAMCIRIQILVDNVCCQKDVNHVYLREAKNLRPDIN